MNRCTTPSTSTIPSAISACLAAVLWISVAAGIVNSPVHAQTDESGQAAPLNVRKFPRGVQRGEMVVLAPPKISMNGKPDFLSVGSRIFDTKNAQVLSGRLINKPVLVNYLRESSGRVHQVWILNSEEARVKLPGTSDTFFNFTTETDPVKPDLRNVPYNQLPTYQQ